MLDTKVSMSSQPLQTWPQLAIAYAFTEYKAYRNAPPYGAPLRLPC